MSATTEYQPPAGARGTSEPVIKEIEEQVSAALSEIFRRAVKDGVVRDNKDDRDDKSLSIPANGLVQDCEFGMILLLGRDWLDKRRAVPREMTEEAVRTLVLGLVTDIVTKLFVRKRFDKGGEYGDVFFSGAPYTRNQRGDYAANLDAAMLVLGFLAPALRMYHEQLAAIDASSKPAPWVQNLRDLALYVCKAGIEYAGKCQVRLPAFSGFSCDPNSLESDTDRSKPYLNEYDRLFYTWTAAETIHDLLVWESNLIGISQGVPSSEVESIRKGIQDLKGVIEEAAIWCKNEFLNRFLTLSALDVTSAVVEIEPFGDKWIPAEKEELVTRVAEYVQHVYHVSQYAAIRSLWPTQITIEEVSDICDQLDLLVTNDILNSNLEKSQQKTLFTALTRAYRLGKGRLDELTYDDDAYYPLVVRSMAALLTRTMDRLVERATRSDISKVVVTFRRVLRMHHRNLVKRRPASSEDKDLWSFAEGQPYTLYATQRTIFALLSYATFLEKMDAWDRPESNAALELEVRNAGRALVENVGKAIEEIVSIALTQPSGRRSSTDGTAIPLPLTDWAAQPIRQWLEDVVRDFENEQFGNYLTAQAENLLLEYRWVSEAKAPAGDKKLGRALADSKALFESLLARYGLNDGIKPTTNDLLPHMFRDLLHGPAQWKAAEPEWFEATKRSRSLKYLIKNRQDDEGKVQ